MTYLLRCKLLVISTFVFVKYRFFGTLRYLPSYILVSDVICWTVLFIPNVFHKNRETVTIQYNTIKNCEPQNWKKLGNLIIWQTNYFKSWVVFWSKIYVVIELLLSLQGCQGFNSLLDWLVIYLSKMGYTQLFSTLFHAYVKINVKKPFLKISSDGNITNVFQTPTDVQYTPVNKQNENERCTDTTRVNSRVDCTILSFDSIAIVMYESPAKVPSASKRQQLEIIRL